MSLVGNERAKLTATYLNGIALIIFGAGGFAPLIAYIYSASPLSNGYALTATSTFCVAVSIGLHVVGRQTLGRLK